MASVVKTLRDPAVARYEARYTEMRDTLPGAGHAWVSGLREAAFGAAQRNGLPTRRVESWKYTDLRSLNQAEFAPVSPADVSATTVAHHLVDGALALVFIDGRFAAELSVLDDAPDGMRFVSLSEALAGGDQGLCEGLGEIADPELPGFAALNAALMQDGAVCRIEDGIAIERPIQLVFVATDGSATETHMRNLIVLGSNSRATFLQTFVSLGASAGFCSVVTEISLGQGADARHVIRQDHSVNSWHMGLTAVRLGRDANFDNFALSTGARLSRNEVRVLLDGEGAECRLNGIALVRGRQHCDNTTDVDHAKAHGHSSQVYKNVLDDRSHSVFQGRIHVAPDSQKTDAHQMNRNLLLSRNAQADSKPELIIHADDVKCSHGATVGDLDQDALFYLQSRGIDPMTARNLMVRGFAAEMIEELPEDAIRAHLDVAITGWLDDMAANEEAA